MRIETHCADGKVNGFVVPIWNINEDPDLLPHQVYMTAVAPRSQKGPHLHMVRRGMFCCVSGSVRIVLRRAASDIYYTDFSGEKYDYRIVHVQPGEAACIYNDGDTEALLINMPSPAWRPDAQDEYPVEDWNP